MAVTISEQAQGRLVELHKLRSQIDEEIKALEKAVIRVTVARDKAASQGARVRRVRHRPVAECGTDGGYYRHRRTLREPACEECKAAHRIAEQIRALRRREKGSL
jgi:hypothetical protein